MGTEDLKMLISNEGRQDNQSIFTPRFRHVISVRREREERRVEQTHFLRNESDRSFSSETKPVQGTVQRGQKLLLFFLGLSDDAETRLILCRFQSLWLLSLFLWVLS